MDIIIRINWLDLFNFLGFLGMKKKRAGFCLMMILWRELMKNMLGDCSMIIRMSICSSINQY